MKKLVGTVVSNRMTKTIVVRVDFLKMHSKYRKQYKVSKRFKAHDETGVYKTGDSVLIQEVRPLSREKRWNVVKLLKRPESIEETEELTS